MAVATFKRKIKDFNGNAALYRVQPMMVDGKGKKRRFVIVSAVTFGGILGRFTLSDSETFIFPANGRGEVERFLEMEGSQRDTLSHKKVLESAGYKVFPKDIE